MKCCNIENEDFGIIFSKEKLLFHSVKNLVKSIGDWFYWQNNASNKFQFENPYNSRKLNSIECGEDEDYQIFLLSCKIISKIVHGFKSIFKLEALNACLRTVLLYH